MSNCTKGHIWMHILINKLKTIIKLNDKSTESTHVSHSCFFLLFKQYYALTKYKVYIIVQNVNNNNNNEIKPSKKIY